MASKICLPRDRSDGSTMSGRRRKGWRHPIKLNINHNSISTSNKSENPHNKSISNSRGKAMDGLLSEIDDDNVSSTFLAFGPCIHGFHSSIRPVVIVDGTFLTAKYRGTLIVATCQDANMQIYPLAWGIVDSENDASWHWFFSKLKEITGDREDLVVISDRHRSLINAVRDVYQNARHGHCIYHIKGNLRTVTRNTNLCLTFYESS
ncbi:hypothetical protein DH2020_033890 [Rehmannia glutinosa]|uniref:MULE transposase domain-containing protein n=1 Tax=Rehmannia glutinosa TaxID=99300 RepID=A0ABR0VAZ8_REHGL